MAISLTREGISQTTYGLLPILSSMNHEQPWPITIVMARYGGIYEVGRWLAFSSQPDQLPPDWDAGDVLCAAFWGDPRRRAEVGGGDSPQSAYEDLLEKLSRRRAGRTSDA